MKLNILIIVILFVSGFANIEHVFANSDSISHLNVATTDYGGNGVMVNSNQTVAPVLPSPPLGLYPYTSKIFSVFQIDPEIIHPNDTSVIHILVTNNANFPLYDVNLGESLNDSKSVMISNIHKIDILNPNQTKTILGVLHVSSDVQPTDYYDIWWNVIAKNETGYMMESMQFHRNLPIIQHVPQTCCDQYIPIPFAVPLKQFKSGIAANDVKCEQGLQLVIKAEDDSPACVKLQTAQKLVERGWGWVMQPIDSIKPSLPYRIIGLENDTGIVTLRNQTYYFETPYYSQDAYVSPVQISFHDVNFTLFPSGFRGGLPIPCNEQGSNQYYWADAKFADGTRELLHILTDNPPCINSIPTMFSNHTNPQAGLTFYDGKMKLLVSVDNQVSQKENTTLPASFEPCDTPYPQSNTGVAVLYMPVNSVGKICVRYSNSNDTPEPMFGIRIFDPNNSYKNATGITTWNDIGNNYTIPKGDSTVIYWVKTGNQTGFYGLVFSCVGTPFAVGYDNNSKIVSSDFPFLGITNSCPVMLYGSNIDSLTGIGVKYIPYP